MSTAPTASATPHPFGPAAPSLSLGNETAAAAAPLATDPAFPTEPLSAAARARAALLALAIALFIFAAVAALAILLANAIFHPAGSLW